MIKARSKMPDVGSLELEIAISMPVDDWHRLMRALPTDYPGWKVGSLISAVLGHVTNSTQTVFTVPADPTP